MSQNPHSSDMIKDPFYCEEPVEVRSAPDGKRKIFGYAALFGVRSREMRTAKGVVFVEEILPGAFDDCDFSDMDCKYDHAVLLSSSRNYRYGVDERGLWYETDYDPMDPDHVSVMRKIQRGDVRGSSFEFQRPLPEDQIVTDEAGIKVRQLKRVRKTWDLGPVQKPAYPATSAFARSLDEADADELEETEDEKDQRDLSGAYDTNIQPTDGQKQAGNYRKGKVKVAGLTISVENPIGSERSGTAPDGREWRVTMRAHYGYILGSTGSDTDHVDVFLSDNAENARVVYVVDQIRPADGKFDEHKVLIGPVSESEARELYLAHYESGWLGLGAIVMLPMEVFRSWVLDGKPKTQPLMYPADLVEQYLYGHYLVAARQILESGGTKMEEQRNLFGMLAERIRNAGGSAVEIGGSAVEDGGTPVEGARNGAESGGSAEEQQLLARRKAEARKIDALYSRV